MSRGFRVVGLLAVAFAAVACGPSPRARAPLFARVEAERAGPLVAQVAAAPEIAEADALVVRALERDAAGDPVAAEILLEAARAKLDLAVLRGRRRDALERARVAKSSAAEATARREGVTATEADETRAIDLAVAKLAEARARAWGTGLDAVDGVRDRVRLRAAEATLLDAREDCAFAVALGSRGPRLEKAQGLVKVAERRLGTGTAVLEAATRARTACLGLHAPESARVAERRVSTLEHGVDLAASMGLEATRDAVGLTFSLEEGTGDADALASFVKAFGGVALVVERWSEPHASSAPEAATVALERALPGAEASLVCAPKMVLADHGKRRVLVRVAPRFGAPADDATSAAAEP